MGCFVRGDKNSMGCFVRGGKSLWDVLSGWQKMAWDVLSGSPHIQVHEGNWSSDKSCQRQVKGLWKVVSELYKIGPRIQIRIQS